MIPEVFSKLFKELRESHNVRKNGYSKKRLDALINNKYLLALPTFLSKIEFYLRKKSLYGEIICDDHNMSKGFSVTESINWLKERNHYQNLTRPRFASGLDEPLLQVADVLCYVLGQHVHSRDNLEPPFDSWWSDYVKLLYISSDYAKFLYTDRAKLYDSNEPDKVIKVVINLVAVRCICDKSILNKFEQIVESKLFKDKG